jgi:hypothetical protein
MKRLLMIFGGLCWFLFALGFGYFLAQYVGGGAGLQFFGPMFSSESVLLGLAHVMGIVMASFLCFAIGVGLCVHAIVPENEDEQVGEAPKNSPEPVRVDGFISDSSNCGAPAMMQPVIKP